MKNFYVFALTFLFATYSLRSQVETKWEKKLSSEIQWQKITTLGNLIVSTKDGLKGINTENGAVNWSISELAKLDKAKLEELPSSPFIRVSIDKSLWLVDQFSGKIVFDSKKAQIYNVKDYFLLYNYNMLIVSGRDVAEKPVIVSVHLSDASVNWTIKEKFGKVIDAKEFTNNQILLVTLFNVYKIKANSGKIVWKKTASKQAEKLENSALGKLFKKAVTAIADNENLDIHFFLSPNNKYYYIGGRFKEEDSFSSFNSKPELKFTSNLNAYNAETGDIVWKNPIDIEGHLASIIYKKDGIILLPYKTKRASINKLEYSNAQGTWGKKGRGLNIRGDLKNYFDTNKGYLIVTEDYGRHYINFLDTNSGNLLFKKPIRVNNNVKRVLPSDNLILISTSNGLNFLDFNAQKMVWKKAIPTKSNLMAYKGDKAYVYDTRKRNIKEVSISNASVKDITSSKLSFKGGEDPRKLELLDDGIVLYSDQNIAKFSFDGKLMFNEYYKAPKAPALVQILGIAASIYATFEANTASKYANQISQYQNENSSTRNNAFLNDLKDINNEYAASASKYAQETFKAVTSRKKATSFGRNYNFIMTRKDRDIVLYRVSKNTGKPEGEINLGRDRKPNYDVDYIANQVYYIKDKKTLISYKIK